MEAPLIVPYDKPDSHEVEKRLKRELRQGFVKKVLGIVSAQLLFTGFVGTLVMVSEDTQDYFKENYYIVISALVVYVFCIISIFCCRSYTRSVPTNYVVLFICTFAMSLMVGFIISFFDPVNVFTALVLTFVTTAALTFYAFTTKHKLSYFAGILRVLVSILMTIFIIGLIDGFSKGLYYIYCFIGVLIYSILIIYDVKLLSKSKYGLSHEDYIIGALILYIDIINLFLEILKLLGRK